MKSFLFLSLSLMLSLSSCKDSGGSPPVGPVNKAGDPIIGDKFKDDDLVFPEGTPMFMALIRLKSPALLSTAKLDEKGRYQTDSELKNQILKEQLEFEKKLKSISEQISVIYRYRLVLNGLAIQAPQSLAEEINQLPLEFIEADESFSLPQTFETKAGSLEPSELALENTMTFIGAKKIHDTLSVLDSKGNPIAVRGQGIKVGIIDSGVDYTHKMLGGSGSIEEFVSMDPSGKTGLFPNGKVVGGYDFAGTNFNSGSHLYAHRIPVPDRNPIDRSGHGTHVAGTVAGKGDGVNTYDGAAPDAEIYALKVFGDGPSGTTDSVVIAALEFAADPNGDFNLDDKLDVVNLSLGGAFGKPHNLYNHAITNIVKGGVVTVAAAGNAGPINSIVGAPSTADDAISVAGSIGNMPHNWQFDAVEFKTVNQPKLIVEAVEGPLTESIISKGPVAGELYYIGLATQDLGVEVKQELNGKVALIDRGKVSFSDKVQRAYDAGAIGIVMVNNEPGDPIVMGGETSFPIPGVMITQALGDVIKEDMKLGPANIDFIASEKFKRPELIDNLAPFSSQGPRDLDSAIKPEITAPGYNIISARMGTGDKGVMNSGTSMSAPHIAGVAALLVQYRKDLQAKDFKSLMMNTGVLIDDEKGSQYSITRQGAGRIDAFRAAVAPMTLSAPGVSLGKLNVSTLTHIEKQIELFNQSDLPVAYSLKAVNHPNMEIKFSEQNFQLQPDEFKKIDLDFFVSPPSEESLEVGAHIEIKANGILQGHIPVLGVLSRSTEISIEQLSEVDESHFNLTLSNQGEHDGMALLFNHLGSDGRKIGSLDNTASVACDLQSAGYRILEKEGKAVMQVGVKLYNPVTSWIACDISLEVDTDDDGVVDREVIAGNPNSYPGLEELNLPSFASLIFHGPALNQIIQDYNKEIAKQLPERPPISFAPALIQAGSMIGFSHSTIALIEVPLEPLGLKSNSLKMRLSVSFNGNDIIDRYDYLGEGEGKFQEVDTTLKSGTFEGLPEAIQVSAGEILDIKIKKGKSAGGKLLAYYPRNSFTLLTEGKGNQSELVPIHKALPPTIPLLVH